MSGDDPEVREDFIGITENLLMCPRFSSWKSGEIYPKLNTRLPLPYRMHLGGTRRLPQSQRHLLK